MNDQGKKQAKQPRPGRVLIILAIIFLVPIVFAWVLFSQHDTLAEGTLNKGHLIKPPFSITLLPLKNDRGQPLTNQVIRDPATKLVITKTSNHRTTGKWLMLYFHPGKCLQQCQLGLYHIRQIRQATGRDMNRIERAILTYPNLENHTKLDQLLKRQFPGMQHLMVNPQQFKQVIKKHVHTPYALTKGTLYIVDPYGNIILSYKPKAKAKYILKDMERLLKVSQIG